jgi:hypothetical protein
MASILPPTGDVTVYSGTAAGAQAYIGPVTGYSQPTIVTYVPSENEAATLAAMGAGDTFSRKVIDPDYLPVPPGYTDSVTYTLTGPAVRGSLNGTVFTPGDTFHDRQLLFPVETVTFSPPLYQENAGVRTEWIYHITAVPVGAVLTVGENGLEWRLP